MESVKKELQKHETTLAESRALFDIIINNHPSNATRLRENASIVHSPVFESGFGKIQLGTQQTLTGRERAAVYGLVDGKKPDTQETPASLSYAQHAIKK